MDKHLKRLQYDKKCMMSIMEDQPRPAFTLAPGPFNRMPSHKAVLAIVQVYSSCSSNASVAVLVRMPPSLLFSKAQVLHSTRRCSAEV